jgi:hypothetical protein
MTNNIYSSAHKYNGLFILTGTISNFIVLYFDDIYDTDFANFFIFFYVDVNFNSSLVVYIKYHYCCHIKNKSNNHSLYIYFIFVYLLSLHIILYNTI